MCGIAGYIGPNVIDDHRIDLCLQRLHHRGPNARGIYHDELRDGRHVYMLHTRLSILDLDERAHQPMRFRSHVLAFNGEVYNYIELRESLGLTVHDFTTTGDTEVLLHQLATRGLDGLDDCEGMWAFAWYDEQRDTLTLCRDRFGEKPLYIYRSLDGLYFASEIKAIAALSHATLNANAAHIRRFLINGYKSLHKRNDTFVEGVTQLPAGCALTVCPDGSRHLYRYWHPLGADHTLADERPCHADDVQHALIESMRIRMRSDVPTACLLSGGVDSTALISIAKRSLDTDLHAFTIVNDDPRYNEREQINATVKALDISHTPIPVDTTDFLDNMQTLVSMHDAPVYTITAYANWLLMRSIAEHGYSVCFSGLGADEIFSGYYDHHPAYLAAVYEKPDLHSQSRAVWQEHIQPVVRNPFLSDPDLFVNSPDIRDHIYLDAPWFADCLHDGVAESFSEVAYDHVLLRNRMLNELFHEAVPAILHEDDCNAMSCSIENRSPFLDRRLFELSRSIPAERLMRDGYTKAVLRDALRGIAPDHVLNDRRKVGFNAPIRAFLDVHDPSTRQRLMDDGPIFDIVKRDRIEALLDEDPLPNSRSKFLFYVISTAMFLETCAS